MVIKKLGDIVGTDHDVDWGNGRSRRFLLRSDNSPFTITETTVKAGTESKLQYLNHVEACYCIDGEGEIESDGKIYKIEPGTLYVPEKDKHFLRAAKNKDLKLVCVFVPALNGQEHHIFALNGQEHHILSDDGFSTYAL